MKNKILVSFVGYLSVMAAMSAMADQSMHVGSGPVTEIKKYQHAQIMKDPKIQAELNEIKARVNVIQNTTVSMAGVPAAKTLAAQSASSGQLSSLQNNSAGNISDLSVMIKQSKLMQVDREYAKFLLSRVDQLNSVLFSDKTVGNNRAMEYQSIMSDLSAVSK